MKRLPISILFLTLPLTAIAQTITIGPIAKTVYCVGDTMFVPYASQGSFNPGNVFKVQLSDASGSFAGSPSLGQSGNASDSIPLPLMNPGYGYRVRAISTNPYRISDTSSTNIHVVAYPSPLPRPSVGGGCVYIDAGFIGDSIGLVDRSSESAGSTFLWLFDQDASVSSSTQPAPKVVYATDGIKTGKLTVTNAAGCSTTNTFTFRVLNCSPVIPKNVHVVTGTETGSDPVVWVLPGGNYTTSGEFSNRVVFAEPGAFVRAEFRTEGLYYLRSGSSFISSNGQGCATVVLSGGDRISWDSYNDVDTLSCADLTFDYSLLPRIVEQNPHSSTHISQSAEQLLVESDGVSVSVRFFDLLGSEILAVRGENALNVDLTPIPAGIYFAIVQAGEAREVRRILVTH
ncbi:MAG: T9SS type A sorting domain-containing protein [Bacteroidota bacterium]|nr:T9SS type A sorting domain-containing protein [Bacteroidota bacterium]MDP4232899.1 T9SS type A sorting domain-containing protein [Bacteroidota bacterium]MDP4241943.1 T9SS type A sorting domain-containing protein [Bacteroidota bacterium]MDP4286846.1 T9SS type A sorting domain-containing protein [Bacteroidota bacterium]